MSQRWPVIWIRDNGGHWHATRTRGRSGIGGEIALRLQVVPPLSHATAWIEVLAAGQSAEARIGRIALIAIVVPGFAWDLEIRGGRSPAQTGWPVHEARPAPGAASSLEGEEFIVIPVIVMGCGLVLPGGAA